MKSIGFLFVFLVSFYGGFAQSHPKKHHHKKDSVYPPPPISYYDTIHTNSTQNGEEDAPQSIDGLGYVNPPDTGPKIYVERMPDFPGGESAMYNFIKKNLKYPQAAKEAGIEETIYMRFVVDSTGVVGRVSVQKGRNKMLIDAATECLKSMPKWTPGSMYGKKVSVYYMLPFKFRLQ